MNFKFFKMTIATLLLVLFIPNNTIAYLPPFVETPILEKEKVHILALEKTCNTRDLGGYPTQSGKITKSHVFLRSDDTDALTDNDIKKLKDYGVKTVIDIRDNYSVEKFPDKLKNVENIRYYHVDIAQMHRISDGEYTNYLEYTGEGNVIKKIFDIISSIDEGVILFHCVGGKDRTGVLSLLLLGLVNVDTGSIIENYIVSYDLIKDKSNIKKIIENDIEKLGVECIKKLHYSSKENINSLIEYISKNYGTFENYLIACGIKQESLNKIKSRFLE